MGKSGGLSSCLVVHILTRRPTGPAGPSQEQDERAVDIGAAAGAGAAGTVHRRVQFVELPAAAGPRAGLLQSPPLPAYAQQVGKQFLACTGC